MFRSAFHFSITRRVTGDLFFATNVYCRPFTLMTTKGWLVRGCSLFFFHVLSGIIRLMWGALLWRAVIPFFEIFFSSFQEKLKEKEVE